jgi:hypothetical protein
MNSAVHLHSITQEEPNKHLSAFMKLAARLGWQVTSIDDLGIHLRKKKTYGSGYLLVGALTAIIAIGILVWLVGLLDYMASSDRILFIPHKDLEGESLFKCADLLLWFRITKNKNANKMEAGTGQPATRPVVEPEGGDKPQPEAEGRSR